MKIAIISNTRPHAGGMTTYINAVAYGFRKLGHDVDIISLLGKSRERKNKPEFTRKIDNILKNRGGLTVFLFVLSKLMVFFQFIGAYLKTKYDFIYVLDVSAANGIRPLEKLLKLKVVFNPIVSLYQELLSQGKIKQKGWPIRYLIKQEKRAYRGARAIIAIAKYTVRYFNEIARKKLPVTIVRAPFNEKNFYFDPSTKNEFRKKYSCQNEFLILFIARLVEREGPFVIFEAFKKIMETEKDIFLIYAGEGEAEETLRNLVKKHGLENKIKILGFIPDEELNKAYNSADVLAMPVFTHKGVKKGQGIVPLEAMACHLPVIASACGGLKDIIQNEKNGLLIPEKDPAALTKAILRIKHDTALRKRLIDQGIKDSNKYKSEVIAQQILEVYRNFFESKNTNR